MKKERIRMLIHILLLALILLACTSCRTVRVAESTVDRSSEGHYATVVGTLHLYDSTHVEDYKTDSTHYILRDHYNIGTRTINTHSTDTIVKIDSVYVESETNTGITKKEYYQLLCWVILLIALLVFVVWKFVHHN